LLRDPIFTTLSGGIFDLKNPMGNSYIICARNQAGERIGVVVRNGRGSSESDKDTDREDHLAALARLFSLLGRLREKPSTSWAPQWIDLVLLSTDEVPKRKVPTSWLHDAKRVNKIRIRISGRHRAEVDEFLADSKGLEPASLDGSPVLLQAEAVMPGPQNCEPRDAIGGMQ
jgi:hypothetical protein